MSDQVPSPPESKPTSNRPPKRARTEEQPPNNLKRHKSLRDDFKLQEKERKKCRHNGGRPPQFWDSLSTIPLVEAALEELDRRNNLAEEESDIPDSTTDQVDCDLVHFARHGGPDLTDLRGISFWEMPQDGDQQSRRSSGAIRKSTRSRGSGSRSGISSSSRIQSLTTSLGTEKSKSPYNSAFRQTLTGWNILPIGHYLETGGKPSPPDNMDEITAAICNTPRVSLEPEAVMLEKFEQFQKAYHLSTSEESVSRTLEMIEGITLSLSSAHVKQGPVVLNNLLSLLPINLVPGNPDRIYGARPEKLDQSVRCELESLLLPTKFLDILCPNFVVHIKGPFGDARTAEIQAVYDGALAARGMEALWAYGNQGQDSQAGALNARTISCTLTDGVLRMYAVHIRSGNDTSTLAQMQQMHQQSPSSPRELQFTTTLIKAWVVRDEMDAFLQGATAFRNGLEWARQQRDECIIRANKRAEALRQAETCALPIEPEEVETCSSVFQSSADPISAV